MPALRELPGQARKGQGREGAKRHHPTAREEAWHAEGPGRMAAPGSPRPSVCPSGLAVHLVAVGPGQDGLRSGGARGPASKPQPYAPRSPDADGKRPRDSR